ncbi:MAG TPA: porin [Gallionella sp.]|nr:porin [Gallionella sp.]
MQKKIIALAIASALAVPAMAFAEATVTGQVNMSYDSYNNGVEAGSQTDNQLNSNNTRLIVKGAEDLGGGTSAIWQLDARVQADTGVNTSTTANQLFAGNNYLGLKSDSMGSLMAGRMDAPYKVARRGLDVFYDVAGDNRASNGAGIAGLLYEDLRLSNALAYMSPDMSGFTIALATPFGAESAVSGDTKGSAYSLAAMYNAGPIFAELGWQDIKYGTLGSGDLAENGTTILVDDKNNAMNLGGGYKTDQFTVNAMVEQTKYTHAAAATEDKRTNYYIGALFNVTPNDGIRAAYTKVGSTSGATNDANQYAIGYARTMSKTTSAYVTYVKTTNNTTGAADPSDISIGVKHSF